MKSPALLLAATLFVPAIAVGQTRDQARLIINVSAGFVGGQSLWQVRGQPLFDNLAGETVIDTLTISRRIRNSFSLGARGIFFHGDHLGFFGEAFLLGLGFDDTCGRTFATASGRNAETCSSIDQSETASSAVEIAGGAMYRFASRKAVSPYVRGSLGFVLASRSASLTSGTFNSAGAGSERVEVNIFPDEGGSKLYLAGGLGAGFTAQVAPSYQIRWEVRDNMVRLPTIAGPTPQDGTPPMIRNRLKHMLSIEVGFDVVLERRHGRRY
ncbi:MAG TPA: hypothetical protein VFL88_09785 [Gemmatimonadales bacterium]|nr:hypothetical protein [Gemmatimonadales bacterium]